MQRKKYAVLLFFLGLAILLYPILSHYYYANWSVEQVRNFEEEKKKLEQEELKKRVELAHAYNQTLDPTRISDPYSDKEKAGIKEYARMLEVKEMMGYVSVPSISVEIPIYAGTTEEVLQKGAGHMEGTSLPVGNPSTHTVITAHRGLPTAELFTHLDKVQVGDVFYIQNIKEKLAYKVDQILVVDPYSFEDVLVSEGKDYATLLTCTPYMINSHRLLVRGYRIPYEEKISEEAVQPRTQKFPRIFYVLLVLFFVVLLVFIIYLVYLLLAYMRKKNAENKE